MIELHWLKTTCIIFIVACIVPHVQSAVVQQQHDSNFLVGEFDTNMLDMLLRADRYDKRLRPPVRGTLIVTVSCQLLSLATPDESSLKYEVEFLLHQEWFDPRLMYSHSSELTFLNAIDHHNKFWLPDTYFVMHGEIKESPKPVNFALRIYQNGTVSHVMRRHLILSCQGTLSIFPFDDKACSFSIESMTHEYNVVQYVWENDDDVLKKSPSLTTLNAYLIHNQTLPCYVKSDERRNFSCLRVDLIFARDQAFYFTTVFIPGIILVTSSFITFWLEWNVVPARAMIGVTTMLNFFTTSNRFRSTLPVVSNLTAMNLWDGVSMCFIYASLLEFVCVNYVGRKRPVHSDVYLAEAISTSKGREMDIENNIFTIECAKCDLQPCKHSANAPLAPRVQKKEPPHPIRVAKNIDVMARVVFPLAYIVFLLFFFVNYKGFHKYDEF